MTDPTADAIAALPVYHRDDHDWEETPRWIIRLLTFLFQRRPRAQ